MQLAVFSTCLVALATALPTRESHRVNHCLCLDNAETKVYDFVVVGGGASGAPVAGRLSERADFDVLLLEAGGDTEGIANIDVPILFPNNFRDPDVDWSYFTVPQKVACKGKVDGQCFIGGGKLLGGSSSINGMVVIRGGKADYDRWEAEGATGWSYDDVLPYFLKLENNVNESMVASGYHATGGPITFSDSLRVKLGEVFLDGVAELGYKIADVNGEEEFSFSVSQQNAFGVRYHTNRGYLIPNKERPNLTIQINSPVTKILFHRKTAIGVQYRKPDGNDSVVCVRKEVLVAAGAIRSPQLLQLSGIGPKSLLNSFDIKVIKNLPVGEEFEDHPTVFFPFTIDEPISATPTKILNAFPEYQATQTGLVSSNINECNGFFWKDDKWGQRQFQINLRSAFLMTPDILRPTLSNIHEQTKADFQAIIDQYPGDTEGFTIAVILLHPRLRGWVRINSTDPMDNPLINPRYLEHPDDLADYATATAHAVAGIENAPALKAIGAKYVDLNLTSCRGLEVQSDEYWRCMLGELAQTGQHPTSTCRMGDVNDPRTVVDPRLRVLGVKNLRVTDASTMPSVMSGNTNIPSMMIGEKAADLIKEDYPKAA